jgi:short-subunit dehydrogenase
MAYPDIDLEGAIVVVTGGARGIGQSTADLFRARRATVCVGDLDSAQSSAAAGVRIVAVDVTSRDSFAGFVTTVIERHRRIDVLVNNAGVMPLGDFLSEDDAISRTTFDVNVWGLIHGMRLVLPHMIARGRGHIVNVASMAGKVPIPGMAVYNGSKFAAVGLSGAVREEYRHTGVSVTAVLPSAVRTRLASGVQLGGGLPTVEPEAVARAIVGSVHSRRAEITVPRYLAAWDVLSAVTPHVLMSLSRKVIRDRRALTSVEHGLRLDYEKSIERQAKGRR